MQTWAVYPRVGGGTPYGSLTVASNDGLSPRGRGNLWAANTAPTFSRSIPAWAGEPQRRVTVMQTWAVYPRVGGGTRATWPAVPSTRGLSPRGRGNLGYTADGGTFCGSIPAWAGEPVAHSACCLLVTVYPRVGGGTPGDIMAMYGGMGLSPRGRGNRIPKTMPWPHRRSIPAWAGEPDLPPSLKRRAEVYPRVGGGTLMAHLQTIYPKGLSPRGRGNPVAFPVTRVGLRSIPAWAGEPSGV